MTTPNTSTGKSVNLSQVKKTFGSGHSNISPAGAEGEPSIRDVSQSLLACVYPPVASASGLTASLAKDRSDGQLVVTLDAYHLWVWKAASSTAASGTVIAPTDVGAGVGRWVQLV